MATKPVVRIPLWGSDAGRTLDPGLVKEGQGWVVNERPPARHENWVKNALGQWAAWAEDELDEHLLSIRASKVSRVLPVIDVTPEDAVAAAYTQINIAADSLLVAKSTTTLYATSTPFVTGNLATVASNALGASFVSGACIKHPMQSGATSGGRYLILASVAGSPKAFHLADFSGSWVEVTHPGASLLSVAANRSTGRVVATGNGSAYSDDGGATWTPSTAGVDGTSKRFDAAGIFAAYGVELWTSTDGTAWTDRTSLLPADTEVRGIEHISALGRWVLSARDTVTNNSKFYTSTAGPTASGWTLATTAPTSRSNAYSIVSDGETAIARWSNEVWVTHDGGINWSKHPAAIPLSSGGAVGGGIFFDGFSRRVVCGNGVRIFAGMPL